MTARFRIDADLEVPVHPRATPATISFMTVLRCRRRRTDGDVVVQLFRGSHTFEEPALIVINGGLASLAACTTGRGRRGTGTQRRAVVDRGLQRGGGVGRVVEVEREVTGRHVRARVRRIDGLQAEFERYVGPFPNLRSQQPMKTTESPPPPCSFRPVA